MPGSPPPVTVGRSPSASTTSAVKIGFENHSFVRNGPMDNFAWPKITFFDVAGKHS